MIRLALTPWWVATVAITAVVAAPVLAVAEVSRRWGQR